LLKTALDFFDQVIVTRGWRIISKTGLQHPKPGCNPFGPRPSFWHGLNDHELLGFLRCARHAAIAIINNNSMLRAVRSATQIEVARIGTPMRQGKLLQPEEGSQLTCDGMRLRNGLAASLRPRKTRSNSSRQRKVGSRRGDVDQTAHAL